MKCPKCSHPLEIIKMSKVTLDRCTDCKGIWFDNLELSSLLKDFISLPKDEEPASKKLTNEPGALKCPKCLISLKTSKSLLNSSLEIDTCSKCSGIWLDFREYQQLQVQSIRQTKETFGNQRSPYASYMRRKLMLSSICDELYEGVQTERPESERDSVYYLPHSTPLNMDPFIGTEKKQISTDTHAHRGKVQLLLSGFSMQTIVTLDEIVTAVEILPDVHLQGLNVIRYDPARIMQRTDWQKHQVAQSDVAGHYFLRTFYEKNNDIIVYKFRTKRGFLRILYHEIGHHVFHYVMNLTISFTVS